MSDQMHPRTSRWTTVIGILVAIISLGLCAAGGYLAWKRTTSPKKETASSSGAKSESSANGLLSSLIPSQPRRPGFDGKPIPAGPEVPTQKKHMAAYRAWRIRKTIESWRKGQPAAAASTNGERFIADAWHWLDQSSGTTESAAIHKRARELSEAERRDPILGMTRALVLWDEQHSTVTLQMMKDAEKGLRDGKYPLLQLGYNQFYQAQLLINIEDKQAGDAMVLSGLETLAEAVQAGEFAPDEAVLAYRIVCDIADYAQGDNIRIQIQEIFQKKKKIDPWLLDIVTAEAEIDKAWNARGAGYADSVNQQGWKGFNLHLDQARVALLDAWKRHPEWPQAATLMIKVTMGDCGEPGLGVRDWFDRAVAARLDYRPAYDSVMWAMRPRWGGSHEVMLKFARECLNTGRFDTVVPYYYIVMLRDIAGEHTQGTWRAVFRQPGVAEELDRLFQGCLKDPEWAADRPSLLAQRAMAQAWCGNYARAQELMKEVPADVKFQWWLLGRSLSWGGVDRKLVEAELRAFTGPQKETLARAEQLHHSGQVGAAVQIYTKVMNEAKSDAEVRACLANRIANIYLEDGSNSNFNESAGHGWTALHRALMAKRDDVVRLLIDNGADLNVPDDDGRTPMLMAMAMDQVPAVKYMLDHGADPSLDPDKQTTALNCAIMRNRTDVVEWLIAKGANVNQISHGKWAPLIQATLTGNVPIVKLLLDKGADPNLRLGPKITPLLRACVAGQFLIARVLIERGADLNATDTKGITALHYCVDRNQFETARLLIEKGARLDMKNIDGLTPLDLARAKKNEPLIKLLEEAGKKTK